MTRDNGDARSVRPRYSYRCVSVVCFSHSDGPWQIESYDDQIGLQRQGFTDDVLKTAKGADQEKKFEEPKCDFPEAHKEVNYIYGGPYT
jgi:hypothetical protein